MPLHTIIEIQMGVLGVEEKRYKLMDWIHEGSRLAVSYSHTASTDNTEAFFPLISHHTVWNLLQCNFFSEKKHIDHCK